MLLGNLTKEEKITLMGTNAAAVPRLKVPAYTWWSEGAHGVAWAGVATVFPALVGAAASFDVAAVRAMGTAIGMEGRAKHNARVEAQGSSPQFYGLDFFAPNINIVRDVRWGRGQETFGEDPFLTATLGVALIRGLQGNKSYGEKYPLVGATAKVRATRRCSRGRLRRHPRGSCCRCCSRCCARCVLGRAPPPSRLPHPRFWTLASTRSLLRARFYALALVRSLALSTLPPPSHQHFFAYNLESDFSPSSLFPHGGNDPQYRLRADINVTETDLRQTYLPAFDAAITRGEARGVMCS